MKKVIAVVFSILLVLSLSSCASNAGKEPATDAQGNVLPSNLPSGAITSMRERFDPMEYAAYLNIFYQNQGEEYANKEVTKEGTFAVLQDEYFGTLRYYVWGYNDKTRCCDYQWEFVPADPGALPAAGSYIRVSGRFMPSDAALDGYWIENAEVRVEETYTPAAYDYDLTTMSPTLAKVQVKNMLKFKEAFENKTVLIYGRAYSTSTLQHPYYDQAWFLDFTADQTPAPGTYLLLGGTFVSTGEGCYLDVSDYKKV